MDLIRPEDRFKWFIASILFAKRISAETAKETYRRLEEEWLTTPEEILTVGWDRLVQVLEMRSNRIIDCVQKNFRN